MAGERKRRLLEGEALLEYAARALAARAHSVGELREKLLRRAAREEDVEPVIRRLRELGYLDDRRLAEHYAAARLENEGLGKIRVVRELRRRRVAPPVAEQAVAKVYRGTDEVWLIEDYLRRKYRSKCLEDLLAEPKAVASVYRRLRSAGFTAAGVISVLRRLARDPELLDPLKGAEES
ncbi:MAG: regulatory protein RecX [Bryobacteraceae bacterium]